MTAPDNSSPVPKDLSVKATFLFRDMLRNPIEGLSVQIKSSAGAPVAAAWTTGADPTDFSDTSATASASNNSSRAPAFPEAPSPSSQNVVEATTDKDGFATTIQNAARGQPIDVMVKNKRGEYVWKATVTPKKDISTFTIISPEYHLGATTKADPKGGFEQNLDLPVVKQGEVMTAERLIKDFAPYVGWSQKVTEQGQIKKDFPARRKEIIEDPKTRKKRTRIAIEQHYRVVDHGKPRTIVFNVLGSRLSYPSPEYFSEDQFKDMAAKLGVEVAAIKAIVHQESKGLPFLENGLPPILYERKHFHDLAIKKQVALRKQSVDHQGGKKDGHAKKAIDKNPYPGHPDLCFPLPGNYGQGGLHQYEKLIRATKLDVEIALMACSWGGFQILGEYYSSCGCATIHEFVNNFMSGTDGQAAIFVQFMIRMKSGAVYGLKNRDWEAVAASYNGNGWKSANPDYATNLGKFYEQFR